MGALDARTQTDRRNLKDLKQTHGGARRKAGMPIVYKTRKTIEKEQAREITRKIITENLEELLDAQIKNAIGIRHLMMRDAATGKLRRVGSDINDAELTKAQIDAALKTGDAFWIYTKDPSVQAFTDLMNRSLDKPAQQVSVKGSDTGPIVIRWEDTLEARLHSGRERVRQLRHDNAATETDAE